MTTIYCKQYSAPWLPLPHCDPPVENSTRICDLSSNGDNKSLYLMALYFTVYSYKVFMLNSVTVGLDYVGHEDILPFSANSEEPFQHDMLNQFFSNSIVNEGTIMCQSQNRVPSDKADRRLFNRSAIVTEFTEYKTLTIELEKNWFNISCWNGSSLLAEKGRISSWPT